jgi:hypothetical protein
LAIGIGRSADREEVPAFPPGFAEATVRVVPLGAALSAAFFAGALGEVSVSVLTEDLSAAEACVLTSTLVRT